MVDSKAIEIKGELKEWRRIADSGNETVATLCPAFGNHIYHFSPHQPGKIMLKPFTLNDTSIIDPAIHVWVREKQDWYQIPAGAAVFDTQP